MIVKRADVFISSTSKDLQLYREAARDAVWRCGMFALAMERDSATPMDAIDYSLDQVDKANVYVGLFAHRYGHIPDNPSKNPNKISITEMEYRRALTRNIPVLIFIIDENVPIQASNIERGAGFHKLNKLKDELKNKYVVAFFTSPEDLSRKVYHSLADLKEKGVI